MKTSTSFKVAAAIILCFTLNIELQTLNCFAQVANGTGAGKCLNYDGVNDYVEVANNSVLQITNTVTITCWVKRKRNDDVDIILEKGGDWTGSETNYGIGLNSVYNNMFYFFFKGGWRGTSGVSDFEWHYYAVIAIHGVANPILFIDGVQKTIEYWDGAAVINLYPSSKPLHVGAQKETTWNYFSKNIIDEVRIWNRALTQTEIRDNMCKKLTGNESGLVGYWRFDEGSGNTVYDASGNGNNGILY